MSYSDLKLQAEKNRKRLLEIIYNAGSGHTGGDLSCMNIVTALYEKILNISPQTFHDKNRDRFVLSKGHCVETLYTVLESKDFLSRDTVATLGKFKSPLAGHPIVEVPGVEICSGALGHGLSVGNGMAIGAKMDHLSYRTYVLMGDGEQGEGSVYEAAMSAHQYKLDNLVAIIDRNHLQISGNTDYVMCLGNIKERWEGIGWDVTETNGDNIDELMDCFGQIDYHNQKPHLIVAHTTKGKGVSFMENVAEWHHGVPSEEQYRTAMKEIDERIETFKEEV